MAGEVFREQVVHWLVGSERRQTDYAGKDMLRWLLYRFRVAQFRRTAAADRDFAGHHWVWATHAEVSRATGLSESQIRRAVDRLERRGLVRQVSDYALNYVPHYRPSADLFRACVALTMPTDKYAIRVANERDRVPDHDQDEFYQDEYTKDLRTAQTIMCRDFHDELRDLVQGFATSTERDRADTLVRGHVQLLERAWEALG